MTKILLLGYIPPLFNSGSKMEAANYRTWQFLEPLIKDGHSIYFCAEQPPENEKPVSVPADWKDKLTFRTIPFGKSGWVTGLQSVHDQFDPDCIVAANFYPSLYATRLNTEKPIWMDFYGDQLTIVQAACYRARSNRGMPTTIQFTNKILKAGDKFSVCAVPQQHMLVGELAMAGRLNIHNFGYSFVEVILPGAAPLKINFETRNERDFISKLRISPDEFVLLWCGGYNTWIDVETLFKGIEGAMARNPKIRFVSVGANTYEGEGNVYQQFLAMIENSPHKDRYSMLGWRPWAEIPQFYAEADVGLNIDAFHYETIYGTRTRLLEMIAAGLPVITSVGSELSYRLRDLNVALVFNIGDPQGLEDQILGFSNNPDRLHQYSVNAIRCAKDEFSFENTLTPLRTWIKDPQKSPDHVENNFKAQMDELSYQARALVRQALWQVTGSDK